MSGVLVLDNDLEHIQHLQKALAGVPVRTVHAANQWVEAARHGHWNYIFLNDCAQTGAYVCAWAAEHIEKFNGTVFIVLAKDPATAKRMSGLLRRAHLHVHLKPRAGEDTTLMRQICEHLKRVSPGSV